MTLFQRTKNKKWVKWKGDTSLVLRPKRQFLKKLKYTCFTRISHNGVCVLKCLILVPLCYFWYLPADTLKCSKKMKYFVSSCTTLNPQLLGKIKMIALVFNQGSDSDYLGSFLKIHIVEPWLRDFQSVNLEWDSDMCVFCKCFLGDWYILLVQNY